MWGFFLYVWVMESKTIDIGHNWTSFIKQPYFVHVIINNGRSFLLERSFAWQHIDRHQLLNLINANIPTMAASLEKLFIDRNEKLTYHVNNKLKFLQVPHWLKSDQDFDAIYMRLTRLTFREKPFYNEVWLDYIDKENPGELMAVYSDQVELNEDEIGMRMFTVGY